jgi:hypothetical protein
MKKHVLSATRQLYGSRGRGAATESRRPFAHQAPRVAFVGLNVDAATSSLIEQESIRAHQPSSSCRVICSTELPVKLLLVE